MEQHEIVSQNEWKFAITTAFPRSPAVFATRIFNSAMAFFV